MVNSNNEKREVPMLPFAYETDLIDARARLRIEVDAALDALRRGAAPSDVETEHLDCKEEAGRRGAGGLLLPGSKENLAAADSLASEVACMANTPGGGVLVVGIDDKTGELLGAAMDEEWLRHRVYERVDVAPAVEVRVVDGVRLLLVFVAEAREPVEDTSGRLRWRTGAHCVPVDRSEWWLHRRDATGADSMAAATSRTALDVSPGATTIARRYLGEVPSSDSPPTNDKDLLTWLGVLQPDGCLTQAGALVLCPSEVTLLELSVWDVAGGDVVARPANLDGLSLIEQIAAVEARLDALNTSVTLTGAFAETAVRRVPPRALREAVLNAAVHRDWMRTEPVVITWTDADSTLDVVSPGGFGGGVTASNALTQRYARHPALADLFRALNLVDKQGMGVDRMMREMLALGHRPPVLAEEAGPRVRVHLRGGRPVVPVMDLMSRIRPAVRQRDVRVALIVHQLLHQPFVTPESLVPLLQRPSPECAEAIEAAAECLVAEQPLLLQHKDVWLLSRAAIGVAARSAPRGVLPYWRPEVGTEIVRAWLDVHDRITSGDYALMTGFTQPGALGQLDRMVSTHLLQRGDATGRNAHFTAGARLR